MCHIDLPSDPVQIVDSFHHSEKDDHIPAAPLSASTKLHWLSFLKQQTRRVSLGERMFNSAQRRTGFVTPAEPQAGLKLTFLSRMIAGNPVWGPCALDGFRGLREGSLHCTAEARRRPTRETTFLHEYQIALAKIPQTTKRKRKILYHSLAKEAARDPLCQPLDLLEENLRSHWYLTPATELYTSSEFSLTWCLTRDALPVNGISFRVGVAEWPDCGRCSEP